MQISDEVVSMAIDTARKHAREVMGVACEIEPETMRAALEAALGARKDELTSVMLTAGARSIGNTASVENHILRARNCWEAMHRAAEDGTLPSRPKGQQDKEHDELQAAACIEDLAAALRPLAKVADADEEFFKKYRPEDLPNARNFYSTIACAHAHEARAVLERRGLK